VNLRLAKQHWVICWQTPPCCSTINPIDENNCFEVSKNSKYTSAKIGCSNESET